MQTRKKRSGRSPLRAAPRIPALATLAALATVLAGCATLVRDGRDGPPGAAAAAVPVDRANQPVERRAQTTPEPIAAAPRQPEPAPAPPPAVVDVIERLRAGFALPAVDDKSVATELGWYAKNPEYLERVFTRASPYLFHIVEEIEARGMPLDLALLPVVESAFDPFAYSHGRAAGLWQIIPGTGKQLGLTQNWWYDGRRDVLDATRAALDYLEQLHEQFDGDWLLAVAGYNSGEGNVARALKRAAAAKKPRTFFGIRSYLPAETRTYVPRLLAIRDLVAASDALGIELPVIENAPRLAVVETGGQIDMALAAELAQMPVDALYSFNAGVNRWATDPDGPHRLVLPVANVEPFRTALEALGERERVQWTRHRVKNGETIGGIAERYQTTVDVLQEVNGLRGTLIRAGDDLMIPHALKSLTAYSQSVDARATRRQNTAQDGERREHLVRSGDSLWSLSQRYGVGVRELASWNAMAPGDVLSVGRKLVVWTDPPAASASAAAAAAASPATTAAAAAPSAASVAAAAVLPVSFANERMQRVTYTVRRGDSLFAIAQRFRVTVGKLIEWNGVSTEKYLQPGQRLVIHVDVTEQSG